MKPLLFLIGYRGAGKTTVGRLLAARVGWDFIDADALLESQCGKTIKEIFASEGEPAFRDKESQILGELCRRQRHVVSTGGGIILREENRRRLGESGYVIWLKASIAGIAARIEADPTTAARRPNLSGGGVAEIEEQLRIREPYYRGCADLEIDTEGQSPEAIVEAILNACNSNGSICFGSRPCSGSAPASAACSTS